MRSNYCVWWWNPSIWSFNWKLLGSVLLSCLSCACGWNPCPVCWKLRIIEQFYHHLDSRKQTTVNCPSYSLGWYNFVRCLDGLITPPRGGGGGIIGTKKTVSKWAITLLSESVIHHIYTRQNCSASTFHQKKNNKTSRATQIVLWLS